MSQRRRLRNQGERLLMHYGSVDQLQRITRGRLEGTASPSTPVRGIGCDSREIQAGDVFWGLKGQHFDGARFAEDAFRHGAWGCVLQGDQNTALRRGASEALARAVADGPRFLLWVEDTQKALAELACWHRRRMTAQVIAVTGSVGKTTTRELIHAALGQCLVGMRSPKNYNNHLGVPLSLLQLEASDAYAVLELGASAPGEIAALAAICQPNIGVLTRISEAHLTGFGNLGGVATSKAELLDALPADGLAVINGDDPWIGRMASRAPCRVVRVGEQTDNDWIASDIECLPGRLRFTVTGMARGQFELPTPGRHLVNAALCAIAVAGALGLPLESIAAGLADYRAPARRCQQLVAGSVTVLDDTYNANPASMRAALELLSDWPGTGRKILVVGDMLELGPESAPYHRRLGNEAAAVVDLLLAYGAEARGFAQGARESGCAKAAAREFESLGPLCDFLLAELRPGDVVLVKGSRAMGMERVVQALLVGRRETHHAESELLLSCATGTARER